MASFQCSVTTKWSISLQRSCAKMPGLRKCILQRRHFLWADNTEPKIPFKINLEINGALFHRLLSVTADSEADPKETAPQDQVSLTVPLSSGAELEGYLPTFAKGKWMQTILASLQIISVLAPFFIGAYFPVWSSKHWFQQRLCKMERMQSVGVCSEETVFIPLGCWRFYAEQLAWPPSVSETIDVLFLLLCLSDRNLFALWISSE